MNRRCVMDEPDATVSTAGPEDYVDLRLYVVNRTPRCLVAYENLVRICDAYAGGPYRIEVIDLEKNPAIAREDQITAIPTLIRLPWKDGTRKIIGTLADKRKVIGELGFAGGEDCSPTLPAAL